MSNRRVFSLLLIAISLCGASIGFAQNTTPYSRTEGALWVGGNASIEVAISKTSGRIERLLDKVSKEDYCNQSLKNATSDTDGNTGIEFAVSQRVSGLRIYDELRQREFSDLKDPGTVTNASESNSAGGAVFSFEKRYPGAEFVVYETFRINPDHVRWDVRVKKTSGPDRTIRVVQFAPLPLGHYQAWAPISDAPFQIKPWLPFSIDYGQSTSGAVGEGRSRTTIPMMVFYSLRNKRAISFTTPFEVPSVRVRFLTNTGVESDFHWNSRQYPMQERPYFLVSHEYLGARDHKDVEAGLLIATHPADWRPALGWLYSKYKEYFDPDPSFDRWDGSFVSGYSMMKDSLTSEDLRKVYAGRRDRGARWEELHGHFPWYGMMIPDPSVKSWIDESHPAPETTSTRAKIAEHCKLTKEFGIGTFLYYNVTESEYWYAQKQFQDSIAKSEAGKPIGAFRSERYPDKRACWLMNADPSTGFGKYMIQQARDMVETYPAAAGFFWDVYGRSYMFDFAHDDGITMINNKPAYYPEFMYQRLMNDHIRPLLRSKGMLITANKPVTVVSSKGLDGIMAMEDAPREDSPAWITAQSYLGLNRHVMILESDATNAEMMFLHCLRYGMFDTDLNVTDRRSNPLSAELLAHNQGLVKQYRPFIEMFRGKQWIFYPQALELPKNTEGNIFRLKDGSVMISMVSAWKHLRNAQAVESGLEVTCRLPDAADMKAAKITAVDLGESASVQPQVSGDTLKINVPKHSKATVILLSK
jgi:hypothetical protein